MDTREPHVMTNLPASRKALQVITTAFAFSALSSMLLAVGCGGSASAGGSTPTGSPAVTFSSSTLSFGSVNDGSASAAQSVMVTNSGNATLAVGSVAVGGTNPSSFTMTSTCGATLGAGVSCAVAITFVPTAAGSLSATLSFADNAANSPQTVALSGIGVGVAPVVSLSASSLSFGSITLGGSSSTQTVTLSNAGNAALTISSIALAGTNQAGFTESTACGVSLAAASTCTITVGYSPDIAGPETASVVLTDSAANNPQSIALTGTGVGVAELTLSATSLSFGSTAVGSSAASQGVTLTNTGSAVVNLTSIVEGGTNATSFPETSTCGSTLAVGSTCTLTVIFTPTTTGTLAANLVITSNATVPTQTITMGGAGVSSSSNSPAVSGTVYTGTAAVAKAMVAIYTINQSSQTLLTSTSVDTNGNYGFNSAGKPSFTCTPGQPMLIVATNIVPHAYATESPSSTPSVSPGNCGSFSVAAINELTTVAAVSALSNFILIQASGNFDFQYGLPNTSYLAPFTTAQNNAAIMVNTSTGTLGTASSLLSVDQAKLTSLADALNTCTGADPAAGTGNGTPCGAFYAASISAPTTATGFVTPLNSLYGMIFIAKFGSSISSVYNLTTTTQPFQPIWTSPPLDFVVRVSPPTTTPALTPAYVAGPGTVTMATASASGGSPGAVIWYTVDGSTPTIGGGTSKLYLSPVSFYTDVTLKAIAQEYGMAPSAVSTALTLNVPTGNHLSVAFPAGTITTGASAVGTVSYSGTLSSTISVTLTSAAPNALSFNATNSVSTTTVQLTALQPTGTFTIYGISAGTSSVTASASGSAPGSQSLRSTSLIAGSTTSAAKSPIYGFSAVNGQAFNNNSEPYPTENNAYQVDIADPTRFAASIINVTWGQLEPAQGSFDFSPIEQALAAIAAGNSANKTHVVAKIRFWAGNNVPTWLVNTEPDGNGGYGVYVGSVGADNHAVLEALSWSSDYEAHFQALMAAIAAEYDTRTALQEMVVSPCTNATDEPFVLDITTMLTGWNGHPSMRAAGFTDWAREHCLEDAAADYSTWSLTPLYLPFNGLSTTDAGHVVSYVGFAYQQMLNFTGTKQSEAIIANQDLQPISCLFSAGCASSGPIFDLFPTITYTVGTKVYPANVSLQISPQGTNFASDCSPNSPDITCYAPFIQWAVTPSQNGATTGTAGFHALELELYPTVDDRYPAASGTTVSGTSNLTSGNLGTLNASDFPLFVP
jgi:hypothetical protein